MRKLITEKGEKNDLESIKLQVKNLEIRIVEYEDAFRELDCDYNDCDYNATTHLVKILVKDKIEELENQLKELEKIEKELRE